MKRIEYKIQLLMSFSILLMPMVNIIIILNKLSNEYMSVMCAILLLKYAPF